MRVAVKLSFNAHTSAQTSRLTVSYSARAQGCSGKGLGPWLGSTAHEPCGHGLGRQRVHPSLYSARLYPIKKEE